MKILIEFEGDMQQCRAALGLVRAIAKDDERRDGPEFAQASYEIVNGIYELAERVSDKVIAWGVAPGADSEAAVIPALKRLTQALEKAIAEAGGF